MMKILAIASGLLSLGSLQAATLVTFDFAGATDNADVALTAGRPTASTADDPGGILAALTTEFTRASTGTSGLYDNESDGGDPSTNFQMKGSTGTRTPSVAIAANGYFEFTVSFSGLASGQFANLTSLTFIAAKSGGGDRGFFLTTNGPADGFGYDAPADGDFVDVAAGDFVSFDLNVDSTRNTDVGISADEFTDYTLDLSGADFQNLTSDVTFRLYGMTGETGQTVQFDNFVLNGNVIPEPGTSALALLGFFGLAFRRRN